MTEPDTPTITTQRDLFQHLDRLETELVHLDRVYFAARSALLTALKEGRAIMKDLPR